MHPSASVHRLPRRLLAAALLGVLLAALGLPAAQPADAPAAAPAPAVAASDAPLYQVELVVFRAAAVGNQENWASVLPGRGFGTPLGSAAQAPQMVHTLAPSNYRLDGVVNGL